jgi:cytochrome c556
MATHRQTGGAETTARQNREQSMKFKTLAAAAALGTIGKNCGGCHEVYRVKK